MKLYSERTPMSSYDTMINETRVRDMKRALANIDPDVDFSLMMKNVGCMRLQVHFSDHVDLTKATELCKSFNAKLYSKQNGYWIDVNYERSFQFDWILSTVVFVSLVVFCVTCIDAVRLTGGFDHFFKLLLDVSV